jgi:hypothetical protein
MIVILPLVTAATQFLLDTANDPVAFGISEVPSPASRVPLAMLTAVSRPAFYALERQTVSETAVSVKITLVFPSFAASAQLLSDTVNCSMTLLKAQILFNVPPVFPAVLLSIRVIAVSAPDLQSVPLCTVFAKVAFVFPPFARGTVFLPTASNRAMRLPKFVISLRHSLSVPHSQPPGEAGYCCFLLL